MTTTVALRHRLRLTAASLGVVLLAALLPAAAAATPQRWLVPEHAPLPTGSVIVGAFPLADALVVESPAAVEGGVAYDTPIAAQSLPPEADESGFRIDSGVATTRAPEVWADGELGERAVVALIDTGVAPVAALESSVVGEIDFSGTGGGDGYGHGTFLASLIAGASTDAPGAAPAAGILSLKVAGPDGSATLGSVLSAMHWLHGVGRGAGIRIASVALGVDADTDAALLLDGASDALSDAGILVVTAAGNDGPGELTSPATATGTFSVGATDDQGTADRSDDELATFSGSGPDRAGVAQPDMTAPGTKIVSWMHHDAAIAVENPQARLDGDLFRGTGTSMATALTAGVAALASSVRPDLDGHALADVLRASAPSLDAPSVVAAAQAAPAGRGNANPKWESPLAPGANGKRKGHGSTAEPQGIRWAGIRWAGIRWAGIRWADDKWHGIRWADDQWNGIRWAGIRWADTEWRGIRWAGIRWAGTHWGDEQWGPGAWGGVRWTNQGWVGEDVTPQGIRWAGIRWAGIRWAGIRWAGVRWAGVRWAGVRWAMVEVP